MSTRPWRTYRCTTEGCVNYGAEHTVCAQHEGPFYIWPTVGCDCCRQPNLVGYSDQGHRSPDSANASEVGT